MKKNVPFIWGSEYSKAFDAIKNRNHQWPYTHMLWPQKISLQSDSSLKGLGAIFFQEGNPVYFVSKSLQPHQKAYVPN